MTELALDQTCTGADKITAHLLKMQQRGVERDTGHGILSAREIGLAVGIETKECRALLVSLAVAGRVRRLDFANGLFWQSVNPLPWEPGGEMAVARERECALWCDPLTVIVQSVWRDRVGTYYRDVKAYPEALRDRAEAHVERENRMSAARRHDDRKCDRHLSDTYTPPPTYRLVFLAQSPNQ